MVAVVIGVLTAELNGSLHQWSNLKRPGPDAGEDGPMDAGAEGPDQDHMFRLVTDTLITGLESRLAGDRDGRGVGL